MRVIVAGAGPVGLTAALLLARRGTEVTVLEAGHGLATESRASTFHPPTLEMLAELGVYDALAARGIVSTTFQYRDRRGGVIAELDLGVLAGDTEYPFRIQCEQSKLTPILLERLLACPGADIQFGAAVTAVAMSSDGVEITAGGRQIRGDWLIGADGAHSVVRRSLGLEFEGLTYPERFLVISTTADLDALLPGIAAVNYVFDPLEWLVILRTPESWRILFPTPDDTPDADELDPARIQARLSDVAPGEWPVLHTTLYRVHQRVATTFRVGRVLLAGDAAHVNNPLGGMGMNSGIHDAVVLATALADHCDRPDNDPADSDAALTAAAERRREVARTYVRTMTHGNWEQIRETDPARRAAVHDALRARAADPEAARDYLLRTSMIDSLRVVVR